MMAVEQLAAELGQLQLPKSIDRLAPESGKFLHSIVRVMVEELFINPKADDDRYLSRIFYSTRGTTFQKVEIVGDEVVMDFTHTTIEPKPVETPVWDWIDVDADTRKKVQRVKNGKPVMKKETVDQEVLHPIRVYLPVSVILGIINEVDYQTILSLPKADYIPQPLQTDTSRVLEQVLRGLKTPEMFFEEASWPTHPAFRVTHAQHLSRRASVPPLRIFLEPQGERFEVKLELVPEGDIKARQDEIKRKTRFAAMELRDSEVLKSYAKGLQEERQVVAREAAPKKTKKAKAGP